MLYSWIPPSPLPPLVPPTDPPLVPPTGGKERKGGAWKVLLYLKKNATDRIVPFRSFILKVPLIKGDLGGYSFN